MKITLIFMDGRIKMPSKHHLEKWEGSLFPRPLGWQQNDRWHSSLNYLLSHTLKFRVQNWSISLKLPEICSCTMSSCCYQHTSTLYPSTVTAAVRVEQALTFTRALDKTEDKTTKLTSMSITDKDNSTCTRADISIWSHPAANQAWHW